MGRMTKIYTARVGLSFTGGTSHWLVTFTIAGLSFLLHLFAGIQDSFFFSRGLKSTTMSFPYLFPKHFFSRAEELLCFLLLNNNNFTGMFPFLHCLLGTSEAVLINNAHLRLLNK